jgi:threonine aldolase
MNEAVSVGRAHGLAVHLDGARMWNAVVDLRITGAELAAPFDSVSLCLSKGLGAPAGSVLSGPSDFIAEARHWRKMLGGGLRQSGVLAAAGLHALERHVDRLVDDHDNAARLAEGLGAIPGVTVHARNTNMVFVSIDDAPADLRARLADAGIIVRLSMGSDGTANARLVTHLDVTADDIGRTIEEFATQLG